MQKFAMDLSPTKLELRLTAERCVFTLGIPIVTVTGVLFERILILIVTSDQPVNLQLAAMTDTSLEVV